jgi:signal transduction histidine kinase
VLKHAEAHRIAVCLRQDERSVTLEVADDGVGFDQATARRQGGLGLPGMEERAKEMGGHLLIESSPGERTKVSVEVRR